MSGPYHVRDLFETPEGYEPLVCEDPEHCTKAHNEDDPATGEQHHYGCECGWCMYTYWSLK